MIILHRLGECGIVSNAQITLEPQNIYHLVHAEGCKAGEHMDKHECLSNASDRLAPHHASAYVRAQRS